MDTMRTIGTKGGVGRTKMMTDRPGGSATMRTHERFSAAEPSVPPRRRWLRRIVWLGFAAMLAGTALGTWLYHRFGSQLETVFAETDRLDPYWRVEDLEAHRPAVADAENGGLRVSA